MNKKFRKTASLIMLAYLVIAVGFYMIGGQQLHYEDKKTGMVSASATVGELLPGMVVRQQLSESSVQIRSVAVRVSTYARENTAHLMAEIWSDGGQYLYSTLLDGAAMEDYGIVTIQPEQPIQVPEGQGAFLLMTSPDGEPGNAVTVMLGSAIATGRAQIAQNIPENMKVTVDGVPLDGRLCCQVELREALLFGKYYWYFALLGGVALLLLLLREGRQLRKGRTDAILTTIAVTKKYNFLIRQLVNRDFKTKYKRSVLGVLWSFLNPLMTMLVQYVVFSTLFRSDIEKYPLYLLTGIIAFNFFNEATQEASRSIVANTPLITKVYIPKLIYPVCSVCFSTINLLISFILLIVVMLLTLSFPTPAFLLVPFGILCLVAFAAGIGMILATYTVFFKDIQFLWNIFTMLWMYATPIFYPESIIPERFLPIYRMNPLYQFVTFLRTTLIQGVSPAPSAYLGCFLCGVIPLSLGVWVFIKNQDKFIFSL